MSLHRRGPQAESLESRQFLSVTNDTLIAQQTALTTAKVTTAWATSTGSTKTVVADIDTGADYTHQDLYDNIWINQAEIPASYKSELVDTDGDGLITFYDLNSAADKKYMTDVNGNGYIDAGDLLTPTSQGGWEDGVNGKSSANDVYTDDIVGWNFANNTNNVYDGGTANEGHGTHTAGIIGATGNNSVGISGVVQKVSEMIVKIFADDGTSASSSAIAAAIKYTADNGAKVANASWGGSSGRNGDAIYTAIKYAGTKGELFVTAAGNDGENLDSSRYNDWPAEYALDNIVTVAASDSTGALARWSNYGSATVDLSAPGVNVLSTLPNNQYGTMSGTSMATPMVTGTLALMISANSSLSAATLKTELLAGVDQTTSTVETTLSKGELNTANAVANKKGIVLDQGTDDSHKARTRFVPRRIFSAVFA